MTVLTRNAVIKVLDNGTVPELVNNVILVRGLPGSGKTTIANMLNRGTNTYRAATDDWFVNEDGKYDFNPSDLVVNHAACLDWFKDRVDQANGTHNIIIHNTFSMFWEFHPYIDYVKNIMSDENMFNIHIIDMYDGGLSNENLEKRNDHGVNKDTIERMRDRWIQWSWQGYEFYVEGIKTNGKYWA
mgnify:CR=1 FL=1